MNKAIPPTKTPAIDQVHQQFSLWRKKRKGRERIPEKLWEAAVSLTKAHSIHVVSRSLRLNHTALKERAARYSRSEHGNSDSDPGFVAVDFLTGRRSLPSYQVEAEAPSGRKLRISVDGVTCGEVVNLINAVWSW